MKHILLIRFSSLGDIVLATSVLPLIKLKYSNVKITFLTSSPFGEILKGHPLIDHLIVVNRKKDSIFNIVDKIKKHHYNYEISEVIDLHHSLRSTLILMKLFWIPNIKVNKRTFLRNLLVLTKKDFLDGEFQVDRLRKDLKLFLGDYTRNQVSSYLGRKDSGVTSLPSFAKNHSLENYIIIAPGASFKPKAWPLSSFVELIAKLKIKYPNKKIITVGSDHEVDKILFTKLVDENLIGQTSLTDLCALIQSADLVFCNDSAVGHIAEAYGVKAVAIMGPTHESFGFALHSQSSLVISQEEIPCRPCSTKGNKPCKLIEPICFTKTTPNDVLLKTHEKFYS